MRLLRCILVMAVGAAAASSAFLWHKESGHKAVMTVNASDVKAYSLSLPARGGAKGYILRMTSAKARKGTDDSMVFWSTLSNHPESPAWEDLGSRQLWPTSEPKEPGPDYRTCRLVLRIINPDVQLVGKGFAHLYEEDVNFVGDIEFSGRKGWEKSGFASAIPGKHLFHWSSGAGILDGASELEWNHHSIFLGTIWTFDDFYAYRHRLEIVKKD